MAKRKSLDFEAMIGKGENPEGFTSYNPNGTGKVMGTGWNRDYHFDKPQVSPPSPLWPGGRTNRTSER